MPMSTITSWIRMRLHFSSRRHRKTGTLPTIHNFTIVSRNLSIHIPRKKEAKKSLLTTKDPKRFLPLSRATTTRAVRSQVHRTLMGRKVPTTTSSRSTTTPSSHHNSSHMNTRALIKSIVASKALRAKSKNGQWSSPVKSLNLNAYWVSLCNTRLVSQM